MPEPFGILLAICFMVFVMTFTIWIIFILPANMAAERGRSPGVWVLISIVGSPPLAILLLIALGDAQGGQYEGPSER
ncbi:hypothetical protein [Tabrizicola sp.]|uniref:hypothetical protein n=1 Tax=Tabrizicola sp. TaxID=2005166 RepID=UPI0025EB4322|nr:hypothetical protein [Tabrizicola sp.]